MTVPYQKNKSLEYDINKNEMFILFQLLTVETETNDEYNVPIKDLKEIANSLINNDQFLYEVINMCDNKLLSNPAFERYLETLLDSFHLKEMQDIDDLFKFKTVLSIKELIWKYLVKSQNFKFNFVNKANIISLTWDSFLKESLVNQIILLKVIFDNIEIINGILLDSIIDEKILISNVQVKQGVNEFLKKLETISMKFMLVEKIKDKYYLLPKTTDGNLNINFMINYIKILEEKKISKEVLAKAIIIILNLNNDFNHYEVFELIYLSRMLQEINNNALNLNITSLLDEKAIENTKKMYKNQEEDSRNLSDYKELFQHLDWLLSLYK